MAFASSVGSSFVRASQSKSSRCTRSVRTARMSLPAGFPGALHDRVFVKVDEKPEETVGGIFLPSSSNEPEKTGVVVAVGQGRYSSGGAQEPMYVSPGDHVLWKDEFGMETVEVDGQKLLALRMPSIVATW